MDHTDNENQTSNKYRRIAIICEPYSDDWNFILAMIDKGFQVQCILDTSKKLSNTSLRNRLLSNVRNQCVSSCTVDFTKFDQIKADLAGCDVLIILLSQFYLGDISILLKAAKQAGVTRIIPQYIFYNDMYIEVHRLSRWFPYESISKPYYGFNIRENKCIIVGSGDSEFCVTSLRDSSMGIVKTLLDPQSFKNKTVVLYTEKLTWNKMIEVADKYSYKKLEVSYVPMDIALSNEYQKDRKLDFNRRIDIEKGYLSLGDNKLPNLVENLVLFDDYLKEEYQRLNDLRIRREQSEVSSKVKEVWIRGREK